MILATDVAYDDATDRANAAGVVFASWVDGAAIEERVRVHTGLAPYEPGAFYKRELPCLLPLIADLMKAHAIDTVIVDGYVELGPGHPGLGYRLGEALGALGMAPAMVGIAKTAYVGAPAIEVFRGGSVQPLFVTARGIDPQTAALELSRMHGLHRVPTLLRRVDRLARGAS